MPSPDTRRTGPPDDPAHGSAWHDPDNPEVTYTYRPDPDPGDDEDPLPWLATDRRGTRYWAGRGELPDILIPADPDGQARPLVAPWRVGDTVGTADPDDPRTWTKMDDEPDRCWLRVDPGDIGGFPYQRVTGNDLPADPVLLVRGGQSVQPGGQAELFAAVTFRHTDGIRAINTVHGPFDEQGRHAAVAALRKYHAPESIETHRITRTTEAAPAEPPATNRTQPPLPTRHTTRKDPAMKTVVWKHQLPQVANTLRLTRGAKIVHFAEQRGVLCLWEAHDDGERATEDRTFEVVGTGVAGAVDPERFLGTALASGGAFVVHLFETT